MFRFFFYFVAMSKSNNLLLFLIPALIWGSTWFVITFQLGAVDPIVSVSYRFALAGIVLFIYSKLKKLPLFFPVKVHGYMALQGFLLFGINYWLVYLSEQHLSSGLVAVAFSTLIFLNIIFGAVFLGSSLKKKVIIGAILGLAGTILIYKPEVESFSSSDESITAIVFCGLSIVFASLGNITSAANQKRGMPVVQTNAFGMIYGAIIMAVIATIVGKPFTFDPSLSYILSLGYLALFGSIIAFTGYLTLIGRIGADKAAYTIVFVPVIALTISTIFEGYQPGIYAIIGIALIIAGNILALRR